MPTNLKSLLSRSRSKNELKLRESKDEISSSNNGRSRSNSTDVGTCCGSCESSGNHGCCQHDSESSFCNGMTRSGSFSQLHGNSSENELSEERYNQQSCSELSFPRTGSSGDEKSGSCVETENFMKSSVYSEISPTGSKPSMIPSTGSVYNQSGYLTSHQFHREQDRCCEAYQCCPSQNYDYDMVGSIPVGSGNGVSIGVRDYSCGGGYYVEEKPGASCGSRVMEPIDNGDMRRNASCKTLFYSCNALHQHSCNNSYESSHKESSDYSQGSCENSCSSSSRKTSSGNCAAVPFLGKIPPTLSHYHPHQQQTRTNVGDSCASSVATYGSPSAPVCCTSSNLKDRSPCQSSSLRKCETVLALSNFHGSNAVSTTTAGNVSNGNVKSYIRNPSTGVPTYPANFSGGTTGASQLSSVPSGAGSGSTNVGGKVKVMKEKIFSTSSSALNCLLHSSSRTGKLLSGWKLSSNGGSTNAGSNSNVGQISGNVYSGSSEGGNCLGVHCQPSKHFTQTPSTGISIPTAGPTTTSGGGSGCCSSSCDNNKIGSIASTRASTGHQHPHKSRSQLSISENSFSTSPTAPLTPINRLRRNISVNNTSSFCPNTSGSLSAHSSYSRSSSVASFGWKEKEDLFELSLECRLCLYKVSMEDTLEIRACACRYCKDCLITYVTFEIQQGADEIACPDASCEKQGVLGLLEVEQLVSPMLLEKHKKFKLFREVEKDSKLMWCPSPGCETVCQIQDGSAVLTTGFVIENDGRAAHGGTSLSTGGGGSRNSSLPFINCPTCLKTYCAECKLSWHPDSSCESFRRKLIKQGKLSSEDDELFSLDSIKKCPFCHVPIEKDSGCAQMMCKRCKHVFCWYCLASLDDDFLLRHYDKGPCKNKLGHSRASVVWHRAQVIGIFAGFGVLVLLASPLLILAAPCLLCCRCRYCANKLDPEESDLV